ncbi:MAG: alpha/beta hydrolase domain-containing protein [Microbacterium sp.]|uniref:alpha/beta hydrolase domain-containing protein n=1 Tax=Microbacterium sp. TaxID=51671 RepID=UPI0039E5834C
MSDQARATATPSFTRLTVTAGSEPFGTAFLPDLAVGFDLDPVGYVEREYLVTGEADLFDYAADGSRRIRTADVPFTTRILVRRPAESSRFSGTVHVEPLHPEHDNPPTWRSLAPHIVRSGHAYVGVTVFPGPVREMIDDFDPERYADLTIPFEGLGFSILQQVTRMLRTAAALEIFGRPVRSLFVSGWSATGSMVRVYLAEGFHAENLLDDGRPVVDGYALCIAGGGDYALGYWPLSDGVTPPPLDDPRRTVQAIGVPVMEILSEYESESNGTSSRDDADGPEDLFRLYQVAGTSHSSGATGRGGQTAADQLEKKGIRKPLREILEEASDARMDLVVIALFAKLERWAQEGEIPPKVTPFSTLASRDDGPCALFPEALPLRREVDGNVIGGVRTPWTEVPTAAYLPHSTPRPGRCEVPPQAPIAGPEYLADIVGHRVPFPIEKLRARYGDAAAYRERYVRRLDRLIRDGWVLAEDRAAFVNALPAGDDWT